MTRSTFAYVSYFYPRSPCGERQCLPGFCRITAEISIHALLAESDIGPLIFNVQPRNFYPRSPCGERPSKIISSSITIYFYPRSPCGERHRRPNHIKRHKDFYPRSPCGERHRRPTHIKRHKDFYPRSPCGERRPAKTAKADRKGISIHALLAESDRINARYTKRAEAFLSTLSLRRATNRGSNHIERNEISIHALLAESDSEHCER